MSPYISNGGTESVVGTGSIFELNTNLKLYSPNSIVNSIANRETNQLPPNLLLILYNFNNQ